VMLKDAVMHTAHRTMVPVFLLTAALCSLLLTSCGEASSSTSSSSSSQMSSLHWSAAVASAPPGPAHSHTLAHGYPVLSAIECSLRDGCLAAGVGYPSGPSYQQNPNNALQEVQTRWSKLVLPIPPTPPSAFVDSVGCTSSRSCVAVGTSLTKPVSGWGDVLKVSSTGVAGTRARLIRLPDRAILPSIACPSSKECEAAGRATYGAAVLPLIESITMSSGLAKHTEPLGKKIQGALSSISCPNATTCYAVGHTIKSVPLSNGRSQPYTVPLVVEEHHTDWRKVDVPPFSQSTTLTSISCTGSLSCVAVGYRTDIQISTHTPVAIELVNDSWRAMHFSSTGLTQGELGGVVCVADDQCLAVGFRREVTSLATAVAYNGEMWAKVSVPNVVANVGSLRAISCSTRKRCFAISTQEAVVFTATSGPKHVPRN